MNEHGNAQGVQMHHLRDEALCTVCALYLARLRSEAFPLAGKIEEPTVAVVVQVPRSTYWLLVELAATLGQQPEEVVVDRLVEATRDPRSRALPFAKEKQIRELWVAGMNTAEIARTVKVTPETVGRRLRRWGVQSNGRRKPQSGNQKKETR